MSGGRFDYAQYRLDDIIDSIKNSIEDNPYSLKEETLEEFLKGIECLKKAYIYTQRIDWLLSGDDGEETFHERLKEDLDKLWKEK